MTLAALVAMGTYASSTEKASAEPVTLGTAIAIGVGSAILGGAIGSARDRDIYRVAATDLPRRHVGYCLQRYRSYRVSDNTFAPRRGERRACVSPFI